MENAFSASSEQLVESPFAELYVPNPNNEHLLDQPASLLESPFLGQYGYAELEGTNLEADNFRTLTAELYDTEFEEALFELTEQAVATAGSATGRSAEALLEAWVQPLATEAERTLDRLSEAVQRPQSSALDETTLEMLWETVALPTEGLDVAQQAFLGKLVKKAKKAVKSIAKVAKKGIALAKKLMPHNLILAKLKPLIRPLLDRVLKSALDKLPPTLRPIADQLAKKFLGSKEAATVERESPATVDVAEIQHEFDARIASLMLVPEGFGQESLLYEADAAARELEASDAAAELHAERLRFAQAVTDNPRDVAPLVQQFIPAILPALKLGISVIGRKNVVEFLAKLVSKVIGPLVGKQAAMPLSQALVDTGLKIVSLEAPNNEDESRAMTGMALAATVEDTVRRLAELEESLLEDPVTREAYAYHALLEAAATHIPAAAYRPNLAPGTEPWVVVTDDGTAKGRPSYKKYAKVTDVEIPLAVASQIKTFGGTTLESYFKTQLGVPGTVARGRLHLYEAVRGTWLSRIAQLEKKVSGLGRRQAWRHLHPLTPETAALLKLPALGKAVSPTFLATRHKIAVGQRFFYFEPADVRTPTQLPRSSEVHVALDFPSGQIRVAIFISEVESQQIAQKLKTSGTRDALGAIDGIVRAGIKAVLGGGMQRRITIIHEAVPQEAMLGAALSKVPEMVVTALAEKLIEWVLKAVGEHLAARATEFVDKTQEQADGVTLLMVFSNVPGFAQLRASLKGALLTAIPFGPSVIPQVSVRISAGFQT